MTEEGRWGGDDWTRPPGPKQALRNQHFSFWAPRACFVTFWNQICFSLLDLQGRLRIGKMESTTAWQKGKTSQTNKRTRRRFRSSTFLQLLLDSNRHNELLASCDKKAKLKDEAESKTGRDHRAQKILDEPEPPTHIHFLLILSPWKMLCKTRKNTKCSWCFYFPKHRGSGVSRARRRLSSSKPKKSSSVCTLFTLFLKKCFLKLGTKYKVLLVLVLSQTQGKRRLHRVPKELPFFFFFFWPF